MREAARKLASSITKEVRKELGIKSPSTVMRKHGGFAAQGFALGLTDHQSLIKANAGRMAGAAIPINGAGGFGSRGTSGPVTVNLTVNPSTGMDEVQVARLAAREITGALEHINRTAQYT